MRGIRFLAVIAIIMGLPGCAMQQAKKQRARVASEAKAAMVGMPKDGVLACMGVPNASGAQDGTEVWSYNSGDGRMNTSGRTSAFTNGQSYTTGSVAALGNVVSFGSHTVVSSSANAFGSGTSVHFYCTVNIVFRDGLVSKVNYTGPTGPRRAPGEQCAYAVQNCVP